MYISTVKAGLPPGFSIYVVFKRTLRLKPEVFRDKKKPVYATGFFLGQDVYFCDYDIVGTESRNFQRITL